jgi:hypothetical protein
MGGFGSRHISRLKPIIGWRPGGIDAQTCEDCDVANRRRRHQQCAVLLDKGYLLRYTNRMKPYLPLALALAICPVGGTLAQTGSPKQPHAAPVVIASPAGTPSAVATQAPVSAPPNVQAPAESTPAAPDTNQAPGQDDLSPIIQPPSLAPGAPGPAAPTQSPPVSPPTPTPAQQPPPLLQMTSVEREYFELGYSLATGAFAYADLARQVSAIPVYHRHDRSGQIRLLAALTPVVLRDRGIIRDNLSETLEQMHNLHAAPSAIAVVGQAADMLNKPIRITGDAKTVTALNPDAGRTLAALNEFERISGITESPTISDWLNGPGKNGVGNVWYAEGLISGVASIAAAQNLPDLLPPVSEISTDLRGLRDWLLIRMPDSRTAAQSTLRKTLDAFLRSTSWPKVQDRSVSPAELAMLGTISRELQNQVSASVVSSATDAPLGSQTASSPPTAGKPQLIDGIAH